MSKTIYGGMSGIQYTDDEYSIGDGIIIRKVYAHLFSPFMMAFKPPGKYRHHDGPWKAAKGGSAFDILAEIEVPQVEFCKGFLSQEDLLFIIGFLIKISLHPYASLPIISDVSFARILESESEPILQPYETKPKIFLPPKDGLITLSQDTLDWIGANWKRTVLLIKDDFRLLHVFKAMENASLFGSKSSSMMLIWGAIEQLFSTNGGELKFRVCANLASYLESTGVKRLELFSELKKLYDQRSTAAHTVKDVADGSIMNSFVYLRNAILKIIENNSIPSMEDFEQRLFNGR